MIWIIFLWIFILVVSIAVLVKSSDWFTEASEKIGLHFGLSPFVVGVTIVAIGTSLPELISSIFSVYANASEIVFGNAIGSNIANIFLVVGFAGVFATKQHFENDNLLKDFTYLIGSIVIISLFMIDGKFTIIESFISIIILGMYLVISINSGDKTNISLKDKFDTKIYAVLFLSGVGLYFGAKYVVSSVVEISDLLHISAELISASVVAVGTSLPELSVSISAARRGNMEIAVGNILGSNVFNLLGVIGISGLFGNLIITTNTIQFLIPVCIVATLIFIFVAFDKKIKRYEGILLLLFYAIFLIALFT